MHGIQTRARARQKTQTSVYGRFRIDLSFCAHTKHSYKFYLNSSPAAPHRCRAQACRQNSPLGSFNKMNNSFVQTPLRRNHDGKVPLQFGLNAGGRHPKKHLRMVPAPESIRAWIRDNPPSCTAIPYYCSNFQTCITCSRVQAASIVDIHRAVLVPIHKFGMQEWNSAEIIVRIAL